MCKLSHIQSTVNASPGTLAYQLAVYDSLYIALAQSLELPLIAADDCLLQRQQRVLW